MIPIARPGGARAASSPQPHPASYLSPPYPALAAGPFPYRACCCASARIWAGNSLSALSLPPQPGRPHFGAPTQEEGQASRPAAGQTSCTRQREESSGETARGGRSLRGFFPPSSLPAVSLRLCGAGWVRAAPGAVAEPPAVSWFCPAKVPSASSLLLGTAPNWDPRGPCTKRSPVGALGPRGAPRSGSFGVRAVLLPVPVSLRFCYFFCFEPGQLKYFWVFK